MMTLMLSQPKIDVDSPVVATAVFDPPIVQPGEPATYRVTLNALEPSITWPDKLAGPPKLELRPGGHGQMLQMVGPVMQPRTSFNYRARAGEAGEFTIPEFTISVYGKPVKIPAAQLQVVAVLPPGVPPRRQLLLKAPGSDSPGTNLFVGQTVRVRLLLPGLTAAGSQFLTQVQLVGQGFIGDTAPAPQRFEPVAAGPGGSNSLTLVYDTALTPIAAGKLSVFAQAFAASNPFVRVGGGAVIIQGQVVIQPGPPQYTLLDSEPVELEVRPLPSEGRLPGFTGAVGSFAADPPTLSTNEAHVGDALKLTVKITGNPSSNLARLVAPPPPQSRDWQVFASPAETTAPQPVPVQPSRLRPGEDLFRAAMYNFITVTYTLIPLTEQARATPAIPFSYFDPQRGVYADLTIPSVPVRVHPGTAAADLQALLQRDAGAAEAESEPVLSSLAAAQGLRAGLVPLQRQAWFPLMQLAPGVAFLGLWGWDRRRRYLERHPEIILRRRARRGLHREWRRLKRAARTGDAPRFATAAVNAMRVACAPHYPAEPRALVGTDVLLLLPESERAGRAGEVVRRFFAVTDASRFAAVAADAAPLLALRPEVEQVLQRLEERL